MPSTTHHAAQGDITTASVRKLTAARDRHPAAFELHEAVLSEVATQLDLKDLTRAINHWEQQVAYPNALAEVESKRRRRRLSIGQTWDGMWALSEELDPESGYIVATALRRDVDLSNLDTSETRTRAQKMADALTDLCSRGSAGKQASTTTTNDGSADVALGSSSGSKPQITICVDYGTLTQSIESVGPLPEVDGLPITPEDVRRAACDASLIPIVLGSRSEVLDVGRATRTVPAALRRALDLGDGGCSWAGCDAPPAWCDAPHMDHWASGGATTLDNLALLCRRHHTATHDGLGHTARQSGTDPPQP